MHLEVVHAPANALQDVSLQHYDCTASTHTPKCSVQHPGSCICCVLGLTSHAFSNQLLLLLLLRCVLCVRFDFTGNGESEGTFRFSNYIGEVGDIQAAKQYLEQQEGQTVIGLLGEAHKQQPTETAP